MSNVYYAYQLRRSDSVEPFYIGKGKNQRYRKHLIPSSLKANNFKNNVIRKAQTEGVEIISEILSSNLSESQAFAIEAYFIKAFGRRDIETGILTNLSDGGEGPSGAKLGPQSEEHIRKRTDNRKPMTLSDEQRAKLSARQRGKFVSEETRRKLSAAHKGRVFTDEHRRKLSEAHKEIPTKVCPHCSKEVDSRLYATYHGDVCKEFTGIPFKNPKVAGENNPNSKLKEEDIRQIRRLVEEGMSKAAVGRMFNIRDSRVCAIVKRKSWAHVV